ncbi:MAG: type II toxin-antitoxin system HicB family antitoxin [Synergistaceae bacterium]|jgi:predicted RNase H-like HicB family nuclease|nr:type II toxin-antitoxin system HicB family antitoxin [Synergistaceae bacterium]
MRRKEKRPDYYSYTATFERDSSDFWFANFPDLESCATNAKTLEEAIIQAQNILEDYMAIIERDGTPIPEPTPCEKIAVAEGAVVQRIVVAMRGARKRWEDRAVNRMVTLPAWLDEKGREANLNFSQLLQAAVAKELKI